MTGDDMREEPRECDVSEAWPRSEEEDRYMAVDDMTEARESDVVPYERRGLYAVAVSDVPSADVEGRRAASVWGVIWRILVVIALLCAMSVVQALYYAMVDTRNTSPGLLGFAGVTWGTWWGSIILLAVFAVGGLAPAIVAFLTAAARPGRRFTPCMAACVVCMALVWAIIPGNAIGESLWWYE